MFESLSKKNPVSLIRPLRGSRGFRQRLLAWFQANKRDLPWRRTRNPYRIWVSEVMLQQTRVAAAKDYYHRFLRAFPTVASLSKADEEEVLAQWSGLGYYRRARMLHAAARQLSRAGKRIPRTAAELQELPGIGRYTAAAIASIAFDEPVAVVDGNVERVISRLYGKEIGGRQDVWHLAQSLLDHERPGDFNQAMMELGATTCLPKNPRCGQCPVRGCCRVRGEHAIATPVARRRLSIDYTLAKRGTAVALMQRSQNERRMAGMWELPLAKAGITGQPPTLRLRHSITNTDYTVQVWSGPIANPACWIQLKEAGGMSLTGLTRKILQQLKLIELR